MIDVSSEISKKLDEKIIQENSNEILLEYLASELDIDLSSFSKERKDYLLNNFIHFICLVIQDVKIINNRLEKYSRDFQSIKNNTNELEYKKKKIEYFCGINKGALDGILYFINNELKEKLLDLEFDTLKRKKERTINQFYLKTRYDFSWFSEYYDIDFDFSTVVKVSYLPDIELFQKLQVEEEYLSLKKENPNEYTRRLHHYIDEGKMLDIIVQTVKENYQLNKRGEIFQDLNELFQNEHYQSFMNLGLLQIEGLFYDFCLMKYGRKENMGTLIEKVHKSLKSINEFNFLKYYPYFAFEIPIKRNEIAHKGMLETNDLKDAAYDLILDLNTVVCMVKLESLDKYNVFLMINNQLKEIKGDMLYKKIVEELILNDIIASECFWKMLKNPIDYEEELDFYKKRKIFNGIDLKKVVINISSMIRNEKFWKELLNVVNKCENMNKHGKDEIYKIAKRLKDDYISILDGEAKKYCIEISKTLGKCFRNK